MTKFKNKGLIQEVTKRKYLKICSLLQLDPKTSYSYKHQRRPCSCNICTQYKYKRSNKHKGQLEGGSQDKEVISFLRHDPGRVRQFNLDLKRKFEGHGR